MSSCVQRRRHWSSAKAAEASRGCDQVRSFDSEASGRPETCQLKKGATTSATPSIRNAIFAVFLAGVFSMVGLSACTSTKPEADPLIHQSKPEDPILYNKYFDKMADEMAAMAAACVLDSATVQCANSVEVMAATLDDIRSDAQASPTKYQRLLAALDKADQDKRTYTMRGCASGGDSKACGQAEIAFDQDVTVVFTLMGEAG